MEKTKKNKFQTHNYLSFYIFQLHFTYKEMRLRELMGLGAQLLSHLIPTTCFPGGSDGKESACKEGDLGLISGLGRSLEKGMVAHSSMPAWRIPWTEELGGLLSVGVIKSRTRLSD